MSNPELNQLPEADPAAIARAIVLRKLSVSAKTRKELEKVLAEKNVPPEVAQAVLDRFTEVGLIDDHLYAAVYARSKHEYKGLSAKAISYQLANKGIAKTEIESAVSAITPEMEYETALAMATKKLSTMKFIDPAKKLDRLVGFLSRKGYSAGICFSVAKAVLATELDLADYIEN